MDSRPSGIGSGKHFAPVLGHDVANRQSARAGSVWTLGLLPLLIYPLQFVRRLAQTFGVALGLEVS